MDIRVTRTKVIINNGYIVNEGEYKVNPCEFTFSEEYTSGLVKKAVFVAGNVEVERAILDDKCDIPYDVLNGEMFELHVYAYEVVEDELVLRYSPTYAKVFLREGSYRGVTGSGEVIEPTQFEQYEQALHNGLDELEEGLQEVANVDIDANKVGSTATVTITNRLGVEKSVQIEDGTDYILTEQDKEDIADIAERDLTPLIPTKVSQLTNDSEYIDKDVNNLTNYTLSANVGSTIELSLNTTTYVMTMVLKNSNGTALSTQTVDFPLETMVVNASYDSVNKQIVIVLENGQTIDVPVGDLISGLQAEITNDNKLSSDLVDDTGHTNKFVTSGEKSTWNSKYNKPSGGIPKADLDSSVQTSLGKADTAIQDLSNYYNKSETYSKTEVDNIVGNINSALDTINGEVV